MSELRRTHRRLAKACTAVLLVIQALGGGAVTLAHASERSTTRVAIEAKHDATCVVLHDALRCALCRYAGIQVSVQRAQVSPVLGVIAEQLPCVLSEPLARSSDHLSAPPRAPPTSRS